MANNPDDWQSYGSLSDATGVPKATIWNLTHWNHYEAPAHGEPLFTWAWNLGYEVTVLNTEGVILRVVKRDVWDTEESSSTI